MELPELPGLNEQKSEQKSEECSRNKEVEFSAYDIVHLTPPRGRKEVELNPYNLAHVTPSRILPDSLSPVKRIPMSPSEQKRVNERLLDHRIHIEDANVENKWNSCCITMDKRAIKFFAQYLILLLVLLFSCFQLVKSKIDTDKQLYTGLITLIIGIIIPSPRLNNN
jgi:hypothetical protein